MREFPYFIGVAIASFALGIVVNKAFFSFLIINKLNKMAQELETLTQEVSETNTVMGSAITLLQGLKTRLDEAIASGNPAALQALSDSLDTNTNALAEAIQTNTPVDPSSPEGTV